jgi:phenylacetate-coenzyme A ligase PaaK-like adenylate-forming protein
MVSATKKKRTAYKKKFATQDARLHNFGRQFIHLKNQETIFSITNSTFNEFALDIFQYQAVNNPVYKHFIDLMGIVPSKITHFSEIPFLPIELFKTHKIMTGSGSFARIFESSSTTGSGMSKHYIQDLEFCKSSFLKCFEYFYGSIDEFVFLALLPGYTERKTSSLIFMVQSLMDISIRKVDCLFTTDFNQLSTYLKKYISTNQKVILIGVTWALLDLASEISMTLSDNIILMETGGMKGRKKEFTRPEVHELLKKSFGVSQIHSEYGMTELQSVAYAKNDGLFYCPPWMSVMAGDTSDPCQLKETGKTGNLRIIDLANIHSCCFIATSDLGKVNPDSSFEILGRTDYSDARGCSLMMAGPNNESV